MCITLNNAPNSQNNIPVPANQQFISQAPITQQNRLQLSKKRSVAPINNNTSLSDAPIPFNAGTPYNQSNYAGNLAPIPTNASTPYNPSYNPSNYAGNSPPNTFSDLWSKFVRKDNIFERYSCGCDK